LNVFALVAGSSLTEFLVFVTFSNALERLLQGGIVLSLAINYCPSIFLRLFFADNEAEILVAGLYRLTAVYR